MQKKVKPYFNSSRSNSLK